jgi:hypothetical protein
MTDTGWATLLWTKRMSWFMIKTIGNLQVSGHLSHTSSVFSMGKYVLWL